MAQTKKADNYISLQDATKYCSHSQEYLSLRARQGKLKAEKFGRNWVTKKEWLKEYITRAEEYNNNLEVLRIKNLKKVKKIRPIKVRKVKEEIWPPANLPIGEFDEREFSKIRSPKVKEPALGFRFAFATALAFILLIAGGVLILSNFVKQNELSSLTYPVGQLRTTFRQTVDNISSSLSYGVYILEETGEVIIEEIGNTTSQIAKGISLAVINYQDISKEYSYWFSDTVKTGTSAFADGVSEFGQNIAEGAKDVSFDFSNSIKKATQSVTFGLYLAQEGALVISDETAELSWRFIEGTKNISLGIVDRVL